MPVTNIVNNALMRIDNPDQLRALYGEPNKRAKGKQLAVLDKHSIDFINKSPFFVLSTHDKSGRMDASPRGGCPGFVTVMNELQLIIPDSKGNNRIDSLVNIVETGRAGTLFLIPGIDETLRVNGSAHISTDTAHLELFTNEKNPPKSCIVIEVEEVFIHCAKALMRSKLWVVESQLYRSELPTIGQMLKDQLGSNEEPESQEAMVSRYQDDL